MVLMLKLLDSRGCYNFDRSDVYSLNLLICRDHWHFIKDFSRILAD